MADTPISLTPNIRSFSFRVEAEGSHGDIGKALVKHVKKKTEEEQEAELDLVGWRRWWASGEISETNDDDELLIQCRELTAAWKDFRKLSVFKKAKHPMLDNVELMPPSMDTLMKTVHDLRKSWDKGKQTRWGKARSNLLAFAEKLSTHKTLFSFFPSENIYTGVLSGVISTVLTACEAHRTVAEGFTRAIREIGAYFQFVQKTGKVMDMFSQRKKTPLDTREVRTAISRAYVPVFKFLCYAIEWHSSFWSRFKTALDRNFYDEKVKEFVDEVKVLAEHVDRVVSQAMADDTNETVHDLAKLSLHIEAQKAAADQFRQLTNAEATKSFALSANLLGDEIGKNIAKALMATEEQHRHDILVIAQLRRGRSVEPPRVRGQVLELESSDEQLLAKSPHPHWLRVAGGDVMADLSGKELDQPSEEGEDDVASPTRHYARVEIEEFSKSLAPFIEDGRQDALKSLSTNTGASIPQEILVEIQKWLRMDKTAFLWVEGPVSPSDLSPTALRVSLVTCEAGIPCVSFFDRRRYSFASSKSPSREEAGLITLLYSLITQLVNLLHPVLETHLDFGRERFSMLDGTKESVAPALEMIRALLSHAPPSIVCVIDGIQDLEEKKTQRYLEELVDIWREQGSRAVVKMLFTTDGMSLTLMKKMKTRERITASRMAQARPGRPAKGYSDLGYLTMR